MDVLTDLLQRSRAHGAAFSKTTAHGDWAFTFPGSASLAIHAIVDGEMFAWTQRAPERVQRLSGGDVLLVRTGVHHLATAPGARCRPWREMAAEATAGRPARSVVCGDAGDGPPGVFFCGAYLFDGDLCAPLLAALPELVRLRPAAGSALRVTIDLLVAEVADEGAGQQALLDRLLDVALVQALRQHLGEAGDAAPGWFRAMAQPGLGDALRALHDEPGHAWSVAELAQQAKLSRATFARRFTEIVGAPPQQYLTDWRMALARERLRDGDDGLAAIAASLGYASEFSFAAAFKRHAGVAPGRWRTESRRAAA